MARRFARLAVLGAALGALGVGGASAAATGVLDGQATAPRAPTQVPLPVIPHLRVTPTSGGPQTTFTVHFTAAEPTGLWRGTDYYYSLRVAPQHGTRGCVSDVSMVPNVTRPGQSLSIRLVPRHFGRQWCMGVYEGSVTETLGPGCGPVTNGSPVACPMFLALKRIGTFRFSVKR